MPKVSVIMPVYNCAAHLGRTVRSVLAQSIADWELVCVNDGSTDGTTEALHRFCTLDSRIRHIDLRQNTGLSNARIVGVKAVRGDYVTFVDAGDRLTRDGLQQLLLAADATGADVTAGAISIALPRLGISRTYSQPRTALHELMPDASEHCVRSIYKAMLCGRLTTSMCDKLFRTGLIKEHLPEAAGFHVGEDYYFSACVIPYARHIHFTDAAYYVWSYSGLGGKYYVRGMADNAKATAAVFAVAGRHAAACGLSEDEARATVARKFLGQTVEGTAYCLGLCGSGRRATDYARKTFATPAMATALEAAGDFLGTPARSLTPETIVRLARRHLRSHRKYYIFTRTLNLFYGI